MKLVVDANVLFSFFKKDSTTRELITSFEIFELYTSSLCIKELSKHKEEIYRKSKISEAGFEEEMEVLRLFVGTVPDEEFKDCAGEAKQLLGEHLKDIPYFALALYLNCGIWSNEKRFKKQVRIKAVSTSDLISFLSEI
ncbi:MAG: PIN domain-containing protein [Halobacteriota archaeon]